MSQYVYVVVGSNDHESSSLIAAYSRADKAALRVKRLEADRERHDEAMRVYSQKGDYDAPFPKQPAVTDQSFSVMKLRIIP